MKNSARMTALYVLQAVRTADAWADASLKAQIEKNGLQGPDAALATRLVYGVLQNRMLLDHWIGAYCSQKPEHLQLPLLDILRLGAYQIVFLDKIPDSAAVNEAVNMTRECGRGPAAGLVNAVLRKISKNRAALPEIPARDKISYLSVRYSHPKWLVKRMVSLLGEQEAEELLKADNAVAPVTIQVNTMKTTAQELTEELAANGIKVTPHAWVPDCLELSGTGNLAKLPAFQKGWFWVQDAAAKLVTAAAAPEAGIHVMDLCAAPGGKSFAAGIALQNHGSILSCDLHENKLKRIREGAERLGLSCIQTAAADGRCSRPEWVGSADLVLVDAPCSGLGIIRKKPDIRYKKPDELFALPVIQTAILDNAAAYVKLGGTLLYSTCTILPEENGQVVDAFLVEHPEFSRESFSLPDPVGIVEGEITLFPQRNQTDGFYLCRLRKQA